MKFCGQCTAPLALICPKCHFQNPPGFKFCGQCTAALGPATAKPEPSRPSLTLRDSDDAAALDGERKTVTALFADIKGSMELMEDLDPEEARAIVDPALKLMIDAVHRYDGYIVQSTGDGVFALFGAPVSHEDHPQRALYAALRMQEDLKRYSDKLRERGQPPLSIRVGANSGEVVVRSIQTGDAHTEYTPIGHSTSLASRLQALAAPGSIAISENLRKVVEGYFLLRSLGPARVKGASEPVNVYEVTGLGPLRTRLQRSAGRGLTKFVGRQREMEAMKHAAEQAMSGHGQIVAAVAEAGVGKSRLFYEFKAVSQSGWMVLEAFSVSHGKASAFLPVIDLLWNYFKISSDDDERTRREKVNGKVLTLDRSLEDALPYLYSLLGLSDENSPLEEMEPQTRKRRSLEAIKRILLRESLNQPLIVIFEDLHWIDEESQAFLNLLVDSIATARILLLVNYRPEYRHEWGHKTYYTQLRLDPLGKESADEMLSALLGDGKDLVPLKRLIIERTQGNPFFMEETVLVLFDEGALVRNGAVKLTRSLNQLKIPPTVQAILAARIDRLAPDHKDLLQTLAVIGTEFKLGLVRKVAPKAGQELEPMLSELQLGEFIYEQPAVGDVEYTFKHALTHDVAYNSLLAERRKVLHERAAEAIEALFAERLDDHIDKLAHHYQRSGNARKAIECLQRAARLAARRAAYAEAKSRLSTALELLANLPEGRDRARQELALQVLLGGTLFTTEGFGAADAARAYERARALCAELRDDAQLPRVLFGLWTSCFFSSQVRVREIAQELAAIAERAPSAPIVLTAYFALASTLSAFGEHVAARENYEKAIRAFDRRQRLPVALEVTRVTALGWLSPTLLILGYPDQAERALKECLTVARESAHPLPLASALLCATIHAWDVGDQDAMRRYRQELGAVAEEHGLLYYSRWVSFLRGCELLHRGEAEPGLVPARGGLGGMRFGAVGRFEDRRILVDGLARAGRLGEALHVVEEELALAEAAGIRPAVLYCLKGELLAMRDASSMPDAEVLFRTAIEIAHQQSAKLWELRATTSLARLLDRQGKRDEARAILADIYNWFTEGFDTAYLKDAKALLDELGRLAIS